jgi:hypothetical protein
MCDKIDSLIHLRPLSAVAGPPRIVDRVPYVQALEEPKRTLKGCGAPDWTMVPPPVRKLDPKNLEAHAGTQCYSVPPSIRKINSKGTAVLNARRGGSRLLRFWVKVPNTSSEIRHNSLARLRVRQDGDGLAIAECMMTILSALVFPALVLPTLVPC